MSARYPWNLRRWEGWGVIKKAGKLHVGSTEKLWVGAENWIETLLRIARRREFQIVGSATAKLREPKHVRARGTNNRDGGYVVHKRAQIFFQVSQLSQHRFCWKCRLRIL